MTNTITPEKLRAAASLLDIAAVRHQDAAIRDEAQQALRQAADEIERLSAPRTIMTEPHDDCECVVCETLRNPPPPTEALKKLMRDFVARGGKFGDAS